MKTKRLVAKRKPCKCARKDKSGKDLRLGDYVSQPLATGERGTLKGWIIEGQSAWCESCLGSLPQVIDAIGRRFDLGRATKRKTQEPIPKAMLKRKQGRPRTSVAPVTRSIRLDVGEWARLEAAEPGVSYTEKVRALMRRAKL